jgi:Lipase/CARDB
MSLSLSLSLSPSPSPSPSPSSRRLITLLLILLPFICVTSGALSPQYPLVSSRLCKDVTNGDTSFLLTQVQTHCGVRQVLQLDILESITTTIQVNDSYSQDITETIPRYQTLFKARPKCALAYFQFAACVVLEYADHFGKNVSSLQSWDMGDFGLCHRAAEALKVVKAVRADEPPQLCPQGCLNGYCTDSSECKCQPGFTGVACNITTQSDCVDSETGQVCSNQGRCDQTDPDTGDVCVCAPGTYGPRCNLGVCAVDCLGNCESDSSSSVLGKCVCPLNRKGSRCEFLASSDSCTAIQPSSSEAYLESNSSIFRDMPSCSDTEAVLEHVRQKCPTSSIAITHWHMPLHAFMLQNFWQTPECAVTIAAFAMCRNIVTQEPHSNEYCVDHTPQDLNPILIMIRDYLQSLRCGEYVLDPAIHDLYEKAPIFSDCAEDAELVEAFCRFDPTLPHTSILSRADSPLLTSQTCQQHYLRYASCHTKSLQTIQQRFAVVLDILDANNAPNTNTPMCFPPSMRAILDMLKSELAASNIPACPQGCDPDNGVCTNSTNGQCICTHGRTGSNCRTVPALCAADCNGNGMCANGQCVCAPGFIHDPNDVSATGQCAIDERAEICIDLGFEFNADTGNCACPRGLYGPRCELGEVCRDAKLASNNTPNWNEEGSFVLEGTSPAECNVDALVVDVNRYCPFELRHHVSTIDFVAGTPFDVSEACATKFVHYSACMFGAGLLEGSSDEHNVAGVLVCDDAGTASGTDVFRRKLMHVLRQMKRRLEYLACPTALPEGYSVQSIAESEPIGYHPLVDLTSSTSWLLRYRINAFDANFELPQLSEPIERAIASLRAYHTALAELGTDCAPVPPYVMRLANQVAAALRSPSAELQCATACDQGTCALDDQTEQYVCRCSNGWSGAQCNVSISTCVAPSDVALEPPLYCSGHGVCNHATAQCECAQNFDGEFCDNKLHLPCENGGVWDSDSDSCNCPPGLSGRYCSRGIPGCNRTIAEPAVSSWWDADSSISSYASSLSCDESDATELHRLEVLYCGVIEEQRDLGARLTRDCLEHFVKRTYCMFRNDFVIDNDANFISSNNRVCPEQSRRLDALIDVRNALANRDCYSSLQESINAKHAPSRQDPDIALNNECESYAATANDRCINNGHAFDIYAAQPTHTCYDIECARAVLNFAKCMGELRLQQPAHVQAHCDTIPAGLYTGLLPDCMNLLNSTCAGCKHGYCSTASPKCTCHQGWTGANCDEKIANCFDPVAPDELLCSGHGICASDACICSPAATGTYCEIAACPYNCSDYAGACDTTTGQCNCPYGTIGIGCRRGTVCDEPASAGFDAIFPDGGSTAVNESTLTLWAQNYSSVVTARTPQQVYNMLKAVPPTPTQATQLASYVATILQADKAESDVPEAVCAREQWKPTLELLVVAMREGFFLGTCPERNLIDPQLSPTAADACSQEAEQARVDCAFDVSGPVPNTQFAVKMEDECAVSYATMLQCTVANAHPSACDASIGDTSRIAYMKLVRNHLAYMTTRCNQTCALSIRVPDDVSTVCGVTPAPQDTGFATANYSTCDPEPEASYVDLDNGLGCPTIIRREWNITDFCGNSRTGIQRISLLSVDADPISPTLGESAFDLRGLFEWPPQEIGRSYDVFIWDSANGGEDARPVSPYSTLAEQLDTPTFRPSFNDELPAATVLNWQVRVNTVLGSFFLPMWSFTTRDFPDLLVSQITVPSTAFTKSSIEVSWVVENLADDEATTLSWRDAVYISELPTFGCQSSICPVYLGSVANPAFLLGNDQYRQTASFALPSQPYGNLYVYVRTDINNQMREQSESNNIMRSVTPIDVQLTPPADLSVDVSGFVFPSTSFSGGSVPITYRVENTGTGSTVSDWWYDTLYISPSATLILNEATWLASIKVYPPNGALKDGESYERSTTATLPQRIDGDYYIHVRTDSNNREPEFFAEGNNDGASTLTMNVILAPPPDLTVAHVNVSSVDSGPIRSGSLLRIQYQVDNDGAGDPYESRWYDNVYVSTSAFCCSGASSIQRLYIARTAIVSTDSYIRSVDYRLPDAAAGTFYFHVHTDVYNNVFEYQSDDNNFGVSSPITVQFAVPDLVVSAASVTAVSTPDLSSVGAGDQVYVSYTVRNAALPPGDVPAGVRKWRDRVHLCGSSVSLSQVDQCIELHNYAITTSGDDSPLVAGATRDEQVTVQLPYSEAIMAGGNFRLRVQTNYDNAVFEDVNSDALNNARFVDTLLTIVAKSADLEMVFTPPSDPFTLGSGQSHTLQFTVKNIGNVATSTSGWRDCIALLAPAANLFTQVWSTTQFHYSSVPLAAGDEYSVSVSVPLSEGFSGNYRIVFDADCEHKVAERTVNRANNVVDVALRVAVPPSPNLQVEDVRFSAAENLPSGMTLVEYNIVNTAPSRMASSGEAYTQSVYLSTSPSLTGSTQVKALATRVGSSSTTAALASGQSLSLSTLVNLKGSAVVPNVLPAVGDYYVYVVADSENAIFEFQGEDDNTARSASPYKVEIETRASDLALSPLNGVPAQIDAGSRFSFNFEVSNLHPTTATSASSWTDRVYFTRKELVDNIESAPCPPTSVPALTAPFTHVGTVLPLSSYTVGASIDIPSSMSGEFYVSVVTDYGRKVDDPDQSNNCLNVQTPVLVADIALPDITIEFDVSLMNSLTVKAGQPLPITYRVVNAAASGPSPPPTLYGSFYNKFYLSRDGKYDLLDVFVVEHLFTTPSTGIAPGAVSEWQTVTGLVRLDVLGAYNVLAAGDSRRSIDEADETNNHKALPITVQLPPAADLIVESVVGPHTAVVGGLMDVAWNVVNQGENEASGFSCDSVFASKDQVWDIDDVLLGQYCGNLVAAPINGTVARDKSVVAGALSPGDYYPIVRGNIRNTLNENDLTNNKAAADNATTLDVAPIALDGSVNTVGLRRGQAVYYRADTPTDVALSVRVQLPANMQSLGLSGVELYIREGQVPTRNVYDRRELLTEDDLGPIAVIDPTAATSYYIMVYFSDPDVQGTTVLDLSNNVDSDSSVPVNFGITAKLIDFGIEHLVQGTKVFAGNAGSFTTAMRASRWTDDSRIILVPAGSTHSEAVAAGTERVASVFFVSQDNKLYWPTFDMTDCVPGTQYDVYGSKNITASLPHVKFLDSAVECAVSTGSGLENIDFDVIAPSSERPNRLFRMQLRVLNKGNQDLPPPFVLLNGGGCQLSFDGGSSTAEQLTFLAQSKYGPMDTLAPGSDSTVRFFARCGRRADFSFSPLDSTADNPYATLVAAAESDNPPSTLRPRHLAEARFVVDNIGTTYADVLNWFVNEQYRADSMYTLDQYPMSLKEIQEMMYLRLYAARMQGMSAVEGLGLNGVGNSNDELESVSLSAVGTHGRTRPVFHLQGGGQMRRGRRNPTPPPAPPTADNVYIAPNHDGSTNDYNPDGTTVVITHGFQNTGGSADNPNAAQDWIQNLADAARDQYGDDSNIIIVDWGSNSGDGLTDYYGDDGAAAATHDIGRDVADTLVDRYDIDPSNTVAIGHSLGTHVNDAMTERLHERTGENTGLVIKNDPADPGFDPSDVERYREFSDHTVQLDTSLLGFDTDEGIADLGIAFDDIPGTEGWGPDTIDRHSAANDILEHLLNGGEIRLDDGSTWTYDDIVNPDNTGEREVPTAPEYEDPTERRERLLECIRNPSACRDDPRDPDDPPPPPTPDPPRPPNWPWPLPWPLPFPIPPPPFFPFPPPPFPFPLPPFFPFPWPLPIIFPRDPNDILGPQGVGDANWVPIAKPMNFKIRFENDPSIATAPAQRVIVRQTPSEILDVRTFRLEAFGWGEKFVEINEPTASYQARIDYVQEAGVLVDVVFGLDIVANEFFWLMQSIDPDTGLPPSDATAGFLPPNIVNTTIGQGFLDYSVLPYEDTSTGSVIVSEATIFFDNQDPIATPAISHTVDAGDVIQQIQALGNVTGSSQIVVEISSSSDASSSGLTNVEVYIRRGNATDFESIDQQDVVPGADDDNVVDMSSFTPGVDYSAADRITLTSVASWSSASASAGTGARQYGPQRTLLQSNGDRVNSRNIITINNDGDDTLDLLIISTDEAGNRHRQLTSFDINPVLNDFDCSGVDDCSDNGDCIANDVCSCFEDYDGLNCADYVPAALPPVCAAEDITTTEDVAALLNILVQSSSSSSSSSSVDGRNESLGLRICGFPDGSSLSSGTETSTGCFCFGQCDEISSQQFQSGLASLTWTPPQDFGSSNPIEISVQCFATRDNSTAESSSSFALIASPIVDTPTLSAENVMRTLGDMPAPGFDTPIMLSISASITDVDGSETGVLRITDVPSVLELSAGLKTAPLSGDDNVSDWVIDDLDDLVGLELVGLDQADSVTLSLEFTVTETDDSSQSESASATLFISSAMPQCPQNCDSCSIENREMKCDVCSDEYEVNAQGTCDPVCDDNCAVCASPGQCSECNDDYDLDQDNVCFAQCDTNCVAETCDRDGQCGECEPGYALFNTTCVIVCSDNCMEGPDACSVPGTCDTCMDGYADDGQNGCAPVCSEHCEADECSSPNTCDKCKSGYRVSSRTGACELIPSSEDECRIVELPYSCIGNMVPDDDAIASVSSGSQRCVCVSFSLDVPDSTPCHA